MNYTDAFDCHTNPAGKVGVIAKSIRTKVDLAAAYTPGVAEVCLRIKDNASLAEEYTNIWNRVLVISDGTATLGLGNTGPLASKPVIEGKVALMSALAGIDGIDLACNPSCVQAAVKLVEQNFGAINLEDIAAPACFEDCEVLSSVMDIAVFHDDQYGTAVVVAAALKRALQSVGKRLEDVRIVIAGAGASAQASVKLLMYMGVQSQNVWMFDSRGLLICNRDLDKYKRQFARDCEAMTYTEALQGADVFIGLSKAGILEAQDIVGMAKDPVIFALANPVAELDIESAKQVRPDGVYATGSSEDHNQVNNVLCFPFLLRGVLDARARSVTMEMLCASVDALCKIPTQYLLPDVFDWRLLFALSTAVVDAASKSGVARVSIDDHDRYKWSLLFRMLGVSRYELPTHPFPIQLPDAEGDCVAVVCYTRHAAPICFTHDDVPQCIERLPGLNVVKVSDMQGVLALGSDYTQYAKSNGKWRVTGGTPRGLLMSCAFALD